MSEFAFAAEGTAPDGPRVGRLRTPRGTVDTPAFMPVGTQATIKSLTTDEVAEVGAQIVLANTFHLYLRPGPDVIERAGGLHRFMRWDRPILTDSGGYQVFSLAKIARVSAEGVTFRSPLDGSEHSFTPEKVLAIQRQLGSDLVMPLDVCLGYPADAAQAADALALTLRWAERSRAVGAGPGQMLFGIVQGGFEPALRRDAAGRIAELGFEGYAIGGLSVGEPREQTAPLLEAAVSALPADRPRYLMGVGAPADLVEGIARGIDLFDCALPTRIARTGTIFTRAGRVNIRNAAFREDWGPLDDRCSCAVCAQYTRAYVRHLFNTDEMLGPRLATYHNLAYLARLMADARAAIAGRTFAAWRDVTLQEYGTTW